MPSVLAIVSKAVFEKTAPKGVAPGHVMPVDRYVSKVSAFDTLEDGGAIFLVTVRPPNERLWLVAIVESPKKKGGAWIGEKNETPIADVTSAIKKLVFASGRGIKAKKGALGMSLQTPQVLTAGDEKLLRGLAGARDAKVAYQSAVAATPAGKDAIAYAKGAAKGKLRFENYRHRASWDELAPSEGALAAQYRDTMEDEELGEAFVGIELIDVVDVASGKVAYHFLLWPFGSGALIPAGTTKEIAYVAQHGFALWKPDPELRTSLAAAFADARERLGIRELVDFKPTREELAAAVHAPPSADFDALAKTIRKLKWKRVEQAHAAAIGAFVKLVATDARAKALLDALLDNTALVGRDLHGVVTVGGQVAKLLLLALADDAKDADALRPETREILAAIAVRPKVYTFDVAHALGNKKWPAQPLLLRRWLGLAKPSPLALEISPGVTVRDRVVAAIRGGDGVEAIAEAVARVIDADQVSELVDDFLRTTEHAAIADLGLEWSKLKPEERRLMPREIRRRSARLARILQKVLALRVPAATLLARIGERVGRDAIADSQLAVGVMLVAAHELGAKIPTGRATAEALAAIASFRDFAEPVRAILERCTPKERQACLMTMSVANGDDGSRWLYADLLQPSELAYVVKYYDLLPDEELTATWIAKLGKRDRAGVEKIVKLLAKQYGAETERPIDAPVRLVDFRLPGGKSTVTLWAAPPTETMIDAPPLDPSSLSSGRKK